MIDIGIRAATDHERALGAGIVTAADRIGPISYVGPSGQNIHQLKAEDGPSYFRFFDLACMPRIPGNTEQTLLGVVAAQLREAILERAREVVSCDDRIDQVVLVVRSLEVSLPVGQMYGHIDIRMNIGLVGYKASEGHVPGVRWSKGEGFEIPVYQGRPSLTDWVRETMAPALGFTEVC